jgi:pimeloyl-ACP methyl ester carboxylesterase
MHKTVLATILLAFSITVLAQPAINNLVLPAGYATSPWGQPGGVKKSGTGPRKMILIPGWGFDWTIFKSFTEANVSDYTFYTVTIPGFGGTQAPPMPADTENFRDGHWTKGVIKGIVDLIDKEKLDKPDILTCFTISEVIAIRLALDHPDKVGKLIIVSGMAKFTAIYPSFEPRTLDGRVSYIEKVMANQWFKTVTTETWNKGNFAPATFCRDSVKAKTHWNMMSAVPIPVMVRYLCEHYCTDVSLEFKNLAVPVLVVLPGFPNKVLSDNTYLAPFFHYSWMGAMPSSPMIHVVVLTDSHAFIMDDQPVKLNAVVKEFLEKGSKAIGPMR